MVRPVLGPNMIARYEHELAAIDGIGLTDIEMDAVVTPDRRPHRGRGPPLAGGRPGRAAHRGQSDQEWWEARAPILERLIDPGRIPIAGRVGQAAGEAHNAAYAPEHTFGFGLQRILDGVEALVRGRASDG